MKKVNDDWSCIGSESISPYAEVCTEAVKDDNVFKKFKSDSRYIAITENVPIAVSYTHLTLPTKRIV